MKNRAKEKEEQRKQDDELIKSGEMTPDEVNKKNGFLSQLDIRNAFISKRRLKINGEYSGDL